MSQATVYFDQEEHPIPLMDLTVILPVGFEAASAEDAGAANLLSDILEGGTATLDRQAFMDKLASYGASTSFAVSNQYSYWKLSFPIVPGKNYDGLIQVLAENWQKPRFTEENFRSAWVKLDAGMKGSLDSDMSMGSATLRRWLNKKEFGGFPVFIDNLAKLKLDATKKVYARDFLGVKEVWAGLVGPKSAEELAKKIVQTVFAAQGKVEVGQHLEWMKPVRAVNRDKAKASKTILILDKPDRNQTVTAVLAVRPDFLKPSDELPFSFGNHILVDSGLGSHFGDEIRNKRGLAYSVGGVSSFYLGMPVIGFAANPVRPRTDEAFGVFASLMKESFEVADLFEKLPAEVWNRQWQSFTFGKILDQSTPMGRLGERMSVVVGGTSPELYKKDVTDWKVKRDEVESFYRDQWKSSIVVMSFVGEAKEIQPLVAKHFPGYTVKVIPYKDSIKAATYN